MTESTSESDNERSSWCDCQKKKDISPQPKAICKGDTRRTCSGNIMTSFLRRGLIPESLDLQITNSALQEIAYPSSSPLISYNNTDT